MLPGGRGDDLLAAPRRVIGHASARRASRSTSGTSQPSSSPSRLADLVAAISSGLRPMWPKMTCFQPRWRPNSQRVAHRAEAHVAFADLRPPAWRRRRRARAPACRSADRPAMASRGIAARYSASARVAVGGRRRRAESGTTRASIQAVTDMAGTSTRNSSEVRPSRSRIPARAGQRWDRRTRRQETGVKENRRSYSVAAVLAGNFRLGRLRLADDQCVVQVARRTLRCACWYSCQLSLGQVFAGQQFFDLFRQRLRPARHRSRRDSPAPCRRFPARSSSAGP